MQMEGLCGSLAEECRAQAVRCDRAAPELVAQEREGLQEQCARAEAARRLRRAEADAHVALGDLRIAQQRAFFVHNERNALEADLETR